MFGAFKIWSHYRLMKLHHGSVLLFTSVLIIPKICFLFKATFLNWADVFINWSFSNTKDLFLSDGNFIWKIRFELTASPPTCITLYESKNYPWKISQKQTYLPVINIFSRWLDTYPKILNWCPHQRSVLSFSQSPLAPFFPQWFHWGKSQR